MNKISISEYGYIGCDNVPINSKFNGKRDLKPKLFDELHNFWLENKEAQKIFSFENKKCLKAQNYVGVIQTKNLSIEILPKIYGENNKDEVRNIFIQMLKPILNINEVQINMANLSTTKNKNIYEIFICLFIQSIKELINKGLKSNYILQEDNQPYLKGKLKFNEHIKRNYIHKERFFVEFDEYLQDRVENRLLKSTIKLLLSKTKDNENKKALRQQLFIFDKVKISSNYKSDFNKISLHRGMEYYKTPLKFAKVFLLHNSFTSLRGKDNFFALLFPMEKLFEEYIAYLLNNSKDILEIKKIEINGGKNEYFLSNANQECKLARLQPDYLLTMNNNTKIIADAKWKLFEKLENKDENCHKVNIPSNDVYQIFSYLDFYNCQETAYLFVPKTDNNIDNIEFTYLNNSGMLDKKIRIKTIDLTSVIKNNKLPQDFLISN